MKTILLFFLLCSQALAFSLAWNPNPPQDLVLSYSIYRTKQHGADLVGTVNSTIVIFNVDAFLNAKRTKFYITATNVNGEGPRSGIVTVIQH